MNGCEPIVVGEAHAALGCEPRRAKQRKRHNEGGKQEICKALADARAKLASSVGYACRKLWRREDIEEVDRIILDLLCEALQRIAIALGFGKETQQNKPCRRLQVISRN